MVQKVKVTLQQAMKAQGEEMSSSTLSLTSALDGVGGQRHAPVTIVEEARWASGSVWTGTENTFHPPPPRIRSLDHQACSESLYWLS
jgi:hypothetical protein